MDAINASDFKVHCLAILGRVRTTRERVVIVERGQPVAELGSPTESWPAYPQRGLVGTVTVVGDIIGPALPDAGQAIVRGRAGLEVEYKCHDASPT